MVISQTPYRVSFAGGGTDLPAFFRHEHGAVLSVTIRQHMYVTVHSRFDSSIRVSYSRTETVRRRAEIRHELVREALSLCGLDQPLEITTIGDVPAGTGMGSSSSLTVGLLNAFYAFQGTLASPARLGEEACRIEIDALKKPIGRQDQYAAAFGGLNYIRFNPDGEVEVSPVSCSRETLDELEKWAILFYTERTRSASDILTQQSAGTRNRMSELRQMRDLAAEMRQTLSSPGDLHAFASLLNEGWKLKRSLGFGITNDEIDSWYQAARRAGAEGGKVLGAGGGGFLLIFAPPSRQESVRQALGSPRELRFAIERNGSRIIFNNE